MTRPSIAPIILLAAAGLRAPQPARATDVTSCGQTIAAGDTAVLQADLDCTGFLYGVRLRPRTTLMLNGHTIAGGADTYVTVLGVGMGDDVELYEQGRGKLTIVGPGAISGVIQDRHFFVGTYACVAPNEGKVTITSPTGTVDVHDCVFGVVGNLTQYNKNHATGTLDHTVLHDNVLEGITVRQLTVSNVTAYANGGAGIHAIARLSASDSTSHDNGGQGFFGTNLLKAQNVTASGNLAGVESFNKVDGTAVVATGNANAGAEGKRVKLTGSTLTGNRVDVLSTLPPALASTTCGTSASFSNVTWGVCADD